MNKTPIYLFSISSHSEAIHVDPLHITFLKPDIDFSLYDHLILTSKQAVKALKHYPKTDFLDKKALCISQATAKAYSDIGGKILEVGKGYGDLLIDTIKTYPKTTKWLYLRAQIVASDFGEVLRKEGFYIDEQIVYKSECLK